VPDVQLWDLAAARPGDFFPGEADEMAQSISWSGDGRSLAGGAHGLFLVLDLERHTRWTAPASNVEHLSWSPDGTRLLVGNDSGMVQLVDPAGKRILRARFPRGEAGAVMTFAWNPDGQTVAIVEAFTRLDLWDTKKGTVRRSGLVLTAPAVDLPVRFSPDGAFLAAPSKGGIALFDGHSAAPRKVLGGRAPAGGAPAGEWVPPGALAWSPDSALIAAMGAEKLEVWEVKSGKLRASLAVKDQGSGPELSWSPDGGRLAFGSGEGLAGIWDLGAGAGPLSLGKCHDLRWTRDGGKVWCTNEMRDSRTGARAGGSEEPFVADPAGDARLLRSADGEALRFGWVELGGAGAGVAAVAGKRLPIVYTDDGYYEGEREAAQRLLFRKGADGVEVALPEAELAGRERKGLLRAFLEGKALPGG
jgi:WD40 repeat protein